MKFDFKGKNVIVTPHISYCGENNKDRLFEIIKKNLKPNKNFYLVKLN